MNTTTGYTPSSDVLSALEAGDITALLAAQHARFGGFVMEAGDGAGDAGDGDASGGDAGAGDGSGDGSDGAGDGSGDDAGDDGQQADDPRVKRANAQAAAERVKRKQLEAELASSKGILDKLAAVFNPESGPEADPAALTGQVEQLTTEAAQLKAELLVHTIAGTNGGNPVALLDSRTFATKLHGLDPSADDYTDQVAAAIKDAVKQNASLAAATGQAPAAGGAPGAGQGSALPAGAVTQEQFNAMGYAERTELFERNPDLYRRLAGTAT